MIRFQWENNVEETSANPLRIVSLPVKGRPLPSDEGDTGTAGRGVEQPCWCCPSGGSVINTQVHNDFEGNVIPIEGRLLPHTSHLSLCLSNKNVKNT